MKMPRYAAILTLLALPLAACGDEATGVDDVHTFDFSFEADMAGWVGDGADLGDPPVTWTVERSEERAEDGAASVRLSLDNVDDQGKIWMERSFQLEPSTVYQVRVTYALATSDWGTTNLWTHFAHVSPTALDTWSDFSEAATIGTGNGATEDVGHVWVDKAVTLVAQTGADGVLHLAIGVWGTSESQREYFIDDMTVRLEGH